jgi:NADPH:quinone reductase-like Zn-dependent oxidoreductase
MHLEINKAAIRDTRLAAMALPTSLASGQVLLSIDKFALTSNNISYVMAGDFLDYWGFFPTEEGWGRLPVMGFGTVVDSNNPDIAVGGRYWGFYPAGSHHVVDAQSTRGGFIDVAPFRAKHANTYRQFDLVGPDANTNDEYESAVLLLRGLFVTSFLADDFFADNQMFGATQLIVTSASSKTSLALAHEARRHQHARVIGMTSTANVDFVEETGLYDAVIEYSDIASIPTEPSIIADMAGNSQVLSAIHHHLGDNVKHSARIGATHWEETGNAGAMPGAKPEFFFAPSQLAKRGKEWGRDVLNARMAEALNLFIDDSTRWMTIVHTVGSEAIVATYTALLNGTVPASEGHVISIR